ncbi:MAG: hypothetical protein ACP5XB_17415 [Isosphaeraceae bacterium]
MRIVNTSPLILLAGADCLELLREPSDSDVIVPGIVSQKVLAGERFDPNVQAIRLATSSWLRIVSTPECHSWAGPESARCR